MNLPAAYVGHAMPNRTRLRIPSRRHNRDYFRHLESTLREQPGITQATVNPVSGSVLIEHDAPLQEIFSLAKELGLFSFADEARREMSIARQLFDIARSFDRELRQATHGRITGTEAGLLLLLALGIYQIWRGNVLPPATALFGYAIGALEAAAGQQA